jgi:DNA-binding response OmpR family regulator
MQQQQTILVVDDDHNELKMMSIALSRDGYQVLIAEDGETGYHRALFTRPDLILLDIMMPPGIDGYETCKKLRAHERTKDIPIIFKSCIGDKPSTFIEGFQVGVDNIITKPCDHDELLDLIAYRLALIRPNQIQAHLSMFS